MSQHGTDEIESSEVLPKLFGAQGKGQIRRASVPDIGGLDSKGTSNRFDDGDDGHEGDESKGAKQTVEAGVDA